jgi:alpha-tubulin suppressor-like RCC1 family protein
LLRCGVRRSRSSGAGWDFGPPRVAALLLIPLVGGLGALSGCGSSKASVKAGAASSKTVAWGHGTHGQLGNGGVANSSVPVTILGLSGVTSLSAGDEHNLALLPDHTVMAWGTNASGELGDGTTAGPETCAGTACSKMPIPVPGLTSVTAVSAGLGDSFALMSDETVRAWGSNGAGQLGDGGTEARSTPVSVAGLHGVREVAAGESYHTLALLSNGTVMAWGKNSDGELGDGTHTDRHKPVAVAGLTGVASVSAGYFDSLAVLKDGTVKMWGLNTSGQLGDGTTTSRAVPTAVPGLTNVTAASAGGAHNLALLTNRTVVAWGNNASGQLGVGSTNGPEKCGSESCSRHPVAVSSIGEVATVSAGGEHSVVLLADHSVRTWGANIFGQLGDGTNTLKAAPVTVNGLNGADIVVSGHLDSLATAQSPPTVTSVAPTSGPAAGGTGVTITGANFTGATSVRFGTRPAQITVLSDTSISATSPPGAGTVDVTVTSAAGTSSTGPNDHFTYLPPPTVVTGDASSITQTEATLNGTVNPNGQAVTDCHFQYGTSTSYGLSAPCTPSPGSGGSPVTVSAQIADLPPNTTYHFRLVATSAGGTGYGQDAELSTLPEPPSVVTGSASSITQTKATLNGTVNPNGGTISDCHFEYGTTTSYGATAPCKSLPGSGNSPIAVSAQIDGLQPNTTYHLRLVASNVGGSAHGEDAELRTLPPPPTAVTGSASSITQTEAKLNGTVNPNGGAVSDCRFEYGTSTSYGLVMPCSSSPGSGTSPVAVAAGIANLQPNTSYHCRLVATNAGGTGYGADCEFRTLPLPPTVDTLLPGPVGFSEATLRGSVNPNGGLVTDCHFDWGLTASYGGKVGCAPAPGSGTAAVIAEGNISGVKAKTTYHFRIVATNAGGTSSSGDRKFETEAKPVKVPHAIGPRDAGEAGLEKAGLNPVVTEVVTNKKLGENDRIFSQDPAAGTIVEEGSEVGIGIETGLPLGK